MYFAFIGCRFDDLGARSSRIPLSKFALASYATAAPGGARPEAKPARATISHVSPFARAVLGGMLGDAVEMLGGEATIMEGK
jgi:hypothetical protein